VRYSYFIILVAIIGILVLTVYNYGEENNSAWLSYEEAVNESEKTGKMLFIFISSPICPVCMEFRELLSKEGMMEKISEKYLPVYIKDPANSPVPVTSFPTFCIGHPGSYDCFHSSSGEMLLKRLGVI
jgi:thioredoxin-related protein